MDTSGYRGDWQIIRGKLKEKCVTLSDNDLQLGEQEALSEPSQKYTGKTRAETEKTFTEFSWFSSY